MKRLEKDLRNVVIDYAATEEQLKKIYADGMNLTDGYGEIFKYRYFNGLSHSIITNTLELKESEYKKRFAEMLRWLYYRVVKGYSFRDLPSFTSAQVERKHFLTILRANEEKAIEWLKTSQFYRKQSIKEMVAKLEYLFELIAKFKKLDLTSTANDLEYEKLDLLSKVYDAIGITTEEFKKAMFESR